MVADREIGNSNKQCSQHALLTHNHLIGRIIRDLLEGSFLVLLGASISTCDLAETTDAACPAFDRSRLEIAQPYSYLLHVPFSN